MRKFILLLTSIFIVSSLSTPAIAQSSEQEYLILDDNLMSTAIEVTKNNGDILDVNWAIDTLQVSLNEYEYAQLSKAYNIFPVQEYKVSGTQSPAPNWGIDRLDQKQLPLSNSFTTASTGKGTSIYIIDSGIRATHKEFTGRLSPDSISFVEDGRGLADCTGHGTHVAGIAAGTLYGVAKESTIIAVRAMDCQNSSNSLIIANAINWVIQHHQAGTPAVLNMSLGGSYDPYINYLVEQLTKDGILVVTASGNSSVDACTVSPGSSDFALNVSATNILDEHASYSNFGGCVDLYAPGGDGAVAIRSASYTSDTGSVWSAGTSMAAPHVAGLAALYFEELKTTNVSAVRERIFETSLVNILSSVPVGTPNLFVNYETTVTIPVEPTPPTPPTEPTPPTPTPPTEPTPPTPQPPLPPVEPTPPAAPSIPTMFSYDVVSKDQIKLSWAAPASQGDGALSSYTVLVYDAVSKKQLQSVILAASKTSVIINRPASTNTIYATITAVNVNRKIGESLITPNVSFPTVPGKIANIKRAYPSKGVADLTWTNPTISADNKILKYQIRVSKNASTKSWNSWVTYSGSKAGARLSKLPSRATRYVEVRVITDGGTGAAFRFVVKAK